MYTNSYFDNQPAPKRQLVEERKGRKKIKSKLLFIFIFIIFNIVFLLFLRSPIFTISHIHVEGLDKLTLDEVCSAAGLREGLNTWKVSPPDLRDSILQIPRVAAVEVERVLPGEVHIQIQEKYPLVLIPFHGSYLELAGDGMIIGLRDDYRGELPLVSGLFWGRMDVGTHITDRERGEIIEVFLQVFSQLPTFPLAEINVSDPRQIIIYTWEGMEVWLGSSTDLEKKLDVLMHLYPRLPLLDTGDLEGYLDLRAADAPVFKPLQK